MQADSIINKRYLHQYLLIGLVVLVYILIYLFRLGQESVELEFNLFADFRGELTKRIELLLPSPQSELLAGILLGEKKDLPSGFKLALRDTSTLHIVVVSGQNLTLLAGFLMGLAGIISRRSAIAISLLAIVIYVLLTGAEIPVLRAGLMSFLSFLGLILGRQRDSVWILFISAAVLLLINPNWVTDLSFQLSFLATFGVIVITPILLKKIQHFPAFIAQDLAVTVGAQLMVFPIIAQNFHQLSLVGVLTNVLVVWTTPLLMVFGTIMLMFSYVFMPIAQIIALFNYVLLTYFVYIVNFFGSLPFAWEYISEKSIIYWIGYYLIIAGFVLYLKKNN